ncbi:MAG: integrase [Methanobacteriaceae archaeon]|jgi:integrase|nr:integrase [Methanobacteriaceae archaeon]
MNLQELINEAYFEENQGIPLKDRNIKRHLIGFRNFLLQNLSPGAAKTYFAKVKTFYNHFEVQLPYLPSAKYGVDYEIYYNDLPTNEHIKNALSISTCGMRAIILFMATSGTAMAETLSLTINDFIKATKGYHDNNSLEDILNTLINQEDIVPTWYLKRIKTDKYYYTFNHPIATNEIVKYLKSRVIFDLNEKLFPFLPSLVLDRFQKINDYFGWGRKGKYRFFRSHTLRKFHASNIGLSAEHVDLLQGRSRNIVHETYIKTNPQKLKQLYTEAMHHLSLTDTPSNNEINYQTQDKNEVNITINMLIFI